MATTTEAPAILSLARLRKCHPCDEQYRMAAACFPEGIPLTIEAMTGLADQGVDYWWGVNALLLASGRKAIARLALGTALEVAAVDLEDEGKAEAAEAARAAAALCPAAPFSQLDKAIYRLRSPLPVSAPWAVRHLLRRAEMLASGRHGDQYLLASFWDQLSSQHGTAGTLVLQAALDLIAGRLRQEG